MRALRGAITTAMVVAAAASAVGVAQAAAARPAPPVLPAFTSGNGITVQSVQRIDDRLYALTLASSVVDGPLHIRVILPDG